MRVCLISDTHGKHGVLRVPECELLVHCGDFSRGGRTRQQLDDTLAWMARQAVAHRILVAGNHDFFCEREPAAARAACAAAGVRYVCDEALEIAGVRIWGSPVTPAFHSLAFNRERGAEIRATWDLIPSDLDLLITHGPPRGLGDRVFFGAHVGCEDLLTAVRRARPLIHAYGHIHEARGEYRLADLPTRFLNVANSPLIFGPPRPPVIVEITPG
jgi:Icc-related predicted phosphoesterase